MGARFYKCPDCRKSNFNINQLHDINHSRSGYISSSTQRSSGVLITAHFVSESQALLLGVCLFSFFLTKHLSSPCFSVLLLKNML